MPAPWLDQPVMLHSSRANSCKYSDEICNWLHDPWRFWYVADYTFGRGAVYFMIIMVSIFTLSRLLSKTAPRSIQSTQSWQKMVSLFRFLSYRGVRISHLEYSTPSYGVMALLAIGFVFFASMTLGPSPYYWPSTPGVKYGGSPPLATRTGWLAIGLLPFVIAFPMKLNFITQLTGVSHERLQVFHRWSAWAMLVLALIHTFPFIVIHIAAGDMIMQWNMSVVYWTGVVALLAQAWLTFASIGPLRNWMYETFKSLHFVVGLVFMIFLFIHCDFRLTSWDYFIVSGVIYFSAYFMSNMRVFMEHGLMTATINPVADEMTEVIIPVGPTAAWAPAQHAFLRFLTADVHALTSHPFTICSGPESGEMRFYVRARKGFTARLHAMARQQPGRKLRVLVDGPYGGVQHQDLSTFDKLVLVVGGSGAGLTLPLIEQAVWKWTQLNPLLIAKCGNCPADHVADLELDEQLLQQAPQKSLHVAMSTRSVETARWYREKLAELLSPFENRSKFFSQHIEIHVTGLETGALSAGSSSDASSSEMSLSESSDVADAKNTMTARAARRESKKLHKGRPGVGALIKEVTTSAAGQSVAIVSCGPASMLHDTRQAASEAQLRIIQSKRGAPSQVYLHSEAFDW